MSEYLTISPSGLKLYKQDHEKIEQYKARLVVGDEKTYSIIDKKTKKVVASNLSKTESDSFFYSETPIDFIFSNFRQNVFINDGTTVGDICDIIENDKLLKMFVEILFPNYPQVRNNQGALQFAEVLFLARSAEVEGQNLTIDYDIGFENGRWFDQDTKVLIDPKLYIPGFPSVLCNFTLLEALCCLFGSQFDSAEVIFKKDGLTETDSNRIINNPFCYLFADCHIEKGTTLWDIFRYVDQYPELKYFMSAYSWCADVDQFHKIAEQPASADPNEKKIWFLEVYRHCSVYAKSNLLFLDPHFHGIGELTDVEKDFYANNPESTPRETSRYSTSWSQINDYAHIPVALKKDVDISIYNNQGKSTARKNYSIPYKLIDILDAIYFDISYLGSPSDITSMTKVMNERLKGYLENDK